MSRLARLPHRLRVVRVASVDPKEDQVDGAIPGRAAKAPNGRGGGAGARHGRRLTRRVPTLTRRDQHVAEHAQQRLRPHTRT